MKPRTIVLAAGVVAVVLLSAGFGYWYGRAEKSGTAAPSGEESEAEVKPVAKVKVALLEKKQIREELVAYGPVVAAPGAAEVLSVPYECRVRKVVAAEGQVVKLGADLIEIEPGPDAALEYSQAKNDYQSAAKDLALVKERFELKLATREDVNSAEQRARDAGLRVQNLEARGILTRTAITSPAAGVVSRMDAQTGQVVPAGMPLLELVRENRFNVRLGVEDEGKDYLQPGETVSLFPINAVEAGPLAGRITMIGRQLDPSTRLVNVLVEPPAGSRLLLNSYVRAVIPIASATGLVAPRSAVLPVEGEYVLFTVENRRAQKRIVKIGLQNDREVQVAAEGLKEGQQVVVVGNAELEDGMEVEVEPAK